MKILQDNYSQVKLWLCK